MGVEHHLVLKMTDVLDRITRSGVAAKGRSREFWKLTVLDVLEKWGVVEVGSRSQVLGKLGLYDLLLD